MTRLLSFSKSIRLLLNFENLTRTTLIIGLLLNISAVSFGQKTTDVNTTSQGITSLNSLKNIPAITTTIEKTWNYTSNPFSVSISAAQLFEKSKQILDNTIYIAGDKSSFSEGYSAFNRSGGTVSIGKTSLNVNKSDSAKRVDSGIIDPDQSILYQSESNSLLNFENLEGQRIAEIIWAAKEPKARNRYWLDLTDANGNFSQALIGYFKDATNGIDAGFDGGVFEGTHVTLYSMCNGIPLSIQGQAMPLTTDKYIVLGYVAANAGTLSISVSQTELDFDSALPILLKDGVAGGMHNIKNVPYFFTTTAGTFNDRFEIHYSDGLSKVSEEDKIVEKNQIIAFKEESSIIVKSENIRFSEIEVYNMQGNILKAARNISANEWILHGIPEKQQVLLINIKTEAGKYITKRIIF